MLVRKSIVSLVLVSLGTVAVAQSLQSISVVPKYLVQGTASFASIVPNPVGAVLPNCTVSESGGQASALLLVYGDLVMDDVFADPIASKHTMTVTCGAAKATFDFLPYGQQPSGLTDYTPAGSAAGTESTSGDGNLVLNLKLSPNTADVGKSARVWITATLPAIAQNTWQVQVESKASGIADMRVFRTASGWVFASHRWLDPLVFPTLTTPNVDSVKFTTIAALKDANDLVVPTGLPKLVLQGAKVKFFVGYQAGTGKYVNLGQVWQ